MERNRKDCDGRRLEFYVFPERQYPLSEALIRNGSATPIQRGPVALRVRVRYPSARKTSRVAVERKIGGAVARE